jgi:proteic killer suppression protein
VEITFATTKLEPAFANDKARVREFGAERAKRLNVRLTQLHDAEHLEQLRALPGRCHELHGDRHGQLAIDVTKNERLIFRPAVDPPPAKADGGLDWSAVDAITILEVEDYHGD